MEETNATVAKRVLYNLVNNGEIRSTMQNVDPANASKWDFLMATDGFNISLVGTGGAELLVQNDGGVCMGNKNGGGGGFDPTFQLDDQGNLTIDGNLTQGSDRNNKQDIVAVDSVSVLETVAKLLVSTWENKGQDGVKHLGPMAQDFHAAFGLGNTEKGISSIDTGGVALAAIKGLNEVVQSKDLEVKSLKAENEELSERLTMLENMVNKLAAKEVVMNQ